jgi:hypothetical protein
LIGYGLDPVPVLIWNSWPTLVWKRQKKALFPHLSYKRHCRSFEHFNIFFPMFLAWKEGFGSGRIYKVLSLLSFSYKRPNALIFFKN